MQTSPVFAISLTLVAYWLADTVWRRFGNPALLHPVLIATTLVAISLIVIGVDHGVYFEQTFVLNEMLGLTVILMAVPLYRNSGLIKSARAPLGLALVTGSLVAILTALALPVSAGIPQELLATLAPKSTTAAVAVEIADRLGGIAGLTAVIVISTGIFGAVFGPAILAALRIEDERAAGFALGVASHAIGTARAFQISEIAGTFASLGMILNAILTIILVPVVLYLVT